MSSRAEHHPARREGEASTYCRTSLGKSIAAVVLATATLAGDAAPAAEYDCRNGQLDVPAAAPGKTVSEPGQSHVLAAYYVCPADIPYEESVHQRLIEATHDIVAWYQVASGGATWELAFPEVVRVYRAQQPRLYYKNNGDWWGSLPGEMDAQGLPIWEPGVVTAILARGAGWWAGGAQGCGVDCGMMILGVEVFPEFNDSAYSGGNCPDGSGVGAWPCTPGGAYAHELGHTLGLPHPIDVPATSAWANHSIMQTHWNYPNHAPPADSPWGLLTIERQMLWTNPFMHTGILLHQPYDQADIVNLPATGPAPEAGFSLTRIAAEVAIANTSTGAIRYLWTLGDGSVSSETDPVHVYDSAGLYLIRLRASATNAMIDLAQQVVTVSLCPITNTGDVDLTVTLNSADIIYLVNFVFKAGQAPLPCVASGDVNCDGHVTAGDIIYIVNHVFKGGPTPCDACTLWPDTWSCE